MANHLRRQIREAVATRVTGLTTTGANVYAQRVRQIPDSALPCLVITAEDEGPPEVLTQGWPRRESRELTIVVKGIAKETDALDDVLDQIAKEVEIAMAADWTLGGLAKNVQRGGTQIGHSIELERPSGEIALTYFITYHAANNAPDAAL